jgi:hypothetical protein
VERCRGGWARSVRRALGAGVLAGARAVAAALGTRRAVCLSARPPRRHTRGRKTLNFAKPSSRFIHKFLPLLPLKSPHEKSQRALYILLPANATCGAPRAAGAQRQAARGTQGVAAQLVCLVSVVHCILMLAPELRRRLSLA